MLFIRGFSEVSRQKDSVRQVVSHWLSIGGLTDNVTAFLQACTLSWEWQKVMTQIRKLQAKVSALKMSWSGKI